MESFKASCVIHSLNGKEAIATILDKVGENNYIAEYNGVKCTALYNPFVGRFYLDDKYGIIRDTQPPGRDMPTR